MIISGGVNIYPAEVEGVLSSHPAVGDVAVIGIPDPSGASRSRRWSSRSTASSPPTALADELVAYCRARLAGFKCPRSVDFTDRLPRTETGKLVKRDLRDSYWATAGRQV